ncbi:MAG TPA: hypothetical protein VES68_02135 [Candidatus Sulfotelmatobacter sp.]|nr:hypothetical protein [Candidatus Sulfotelmatobacter sp.]
MKIKTLVIFITLIIFLKLPIESFAQGVDIGVYPPIFQAQVTAPTDVNVPFYVENFTDQPVSLNISIKPFTAADSENGQVQFLDDASNFPDPAILEKVKILDNSIPISGLDLSPKQKRNLTLEIKIPPDQPKGDYYFSIIFNSNPDTLNSNSTGASAGVASNVLLTVGPVGKTQGIIEEFSSPFLSFKGPLPFTVKLRNISDHFVTIKGDIIIKNMFGQSVGKITLLPVNVLSNTIRRIPDSLQSGASDKDYAKIKDVVEKNQFPVAVWPEKFLLGPYTASLTLSMSDQGPIYQRQITFFAFPLEYLLAILLIIGVVVYIVVRLRKRLKYNL